MDKKTQLSISIPGLMEDWNAYKKGLKEIMRIAIRFQKWNAVSGQNGFNPHRKCLKNKIFYVRHKRSVLPGGRKFSDTGTCFN